MNFDSQNQLRWEWQDNFAIYFLTFFEHQNCWMQNLMSLLHTHDAYCLTSSWYDSRYLIIVVKTWMSSNILHWFLSTVTQLIIFNEKFNQITFCSCLATLLRTVKECINIHILSTGIKRVIDLSNLGHYVKRHLWLLLKPLLDGQNMTSEGKKYSTFY